MSVAEKVVRAEWSPAALRVLTVWIWRHWVLSGDKCGGRANYSFATKKMSILHAAIFCQWCSLPSAYLALFPTPSPGDQAERAPLIRSRVRTGWQLTEFNSLRWNQFYAKASKSFVLGAHPLKTECQLSLQDRLCSWRTEWWVVREQLSGTPGSSSGPL